MQPESLRNKRCKPCEGGVDPLSEQEALDLLCHLADWRMSEDVTRLHRRFEFRDFAENMAFLNRVADLAEAEGHHPDFCVHYKRSDFTVWTHAIGGLSENDFILAAKINALLDA